MRVGYARVSTTDQDIDSQVARLADCDKVFSEKWSGKKQDRRELAACLEFVREGDVLVCTRLDRLARSVMDLCTITDGLQRKGVSLVVLDQQIDTSTAVGKLVFHTLAAIAEFELGIRKEQQRVGMDRARASGKQMGRRYMLSRQERVDLAMLYREGQTAKSLARRFHISDRTVRRYAAEIGGF